MNWLDFRGKAQVCGGEDIHVDAGTWKYIFLLQLKLVLFVEW